MWILKSVLALSVMFSLVAKAESAPLFIKNISAQVSSDDSVLLLVRGYLADTCTELGETEVSLNVHTGEIQIEQHAIEIPDTVCGDQTIPFEKTISLGFLRSGDYRIETNRGTVVETFSVRQFQDQDF